MMKCAIQVTYGEPLWGVGSNLPPRSGSLNGPRPSGRFFVLKVFMTASPRFRDSGNHLLDLLPDAEFDSIEPMLQPTSLPIRQVVHQFDAEVSHVHFPTSAIISLLAVLEEDDPVETSTVGRDGFVGLSAALGVAESPHRAICQMDGESFRVPIRPFIAAIARCPGLNDVMHRYIAFSLRSAARSIACNAVHTVEARASRWLLLVSDQAGRAAFPMTHEFLAFMLGVRRQTVTVVAGTLQNAGLIAYRRGSIEIVDRPGLELAACECYASIRADYHRVMG